MATPGAGPVAAARPAAHQDPRAFAGLTVQETRRALTDTRIALLRHAATDEDAIVRTELPRDVPAARRAVGDLARHGDVEPMESAAGPDVRRVGLRITRAGRAALDDLPVDGRRLA
jgi:hypothetical protein